MSAWIILSVSHLIMPSIRSNINLQTKIVIKSYADVLTTLLVIHRMAEKLISIAGIPDFNN